MLSQSLVLRLCVEVETYLHLAKCSLFYSIFSFSVVLKSFELQGRLPFYVARQRAKMKKWLKLCCCSRLENRSVLIRNSNFWTFNK